MNKRAGVVVGPQPSVSPVAFLSFVFFPISPRSVACFAWRCPAVKGIAGSRLVLSYLSDAACVWDRRQAATASGSPVERCVSKLTAKSDRGLRLLCMECSAKGSARLFWQRKAGGRRRASGDRDGAPRAGARGPGPDHRTTGEVGIAR